VDDESLKGAMILGGEEHSGMMIQGNMEEQEGSITRVIDNISDVDAATDSDDGNGDDNSSSDSGSGAGSGLSSAAAEEAALVE
jgi:hypothetical protein